MNDYLDTVQVLNLLCGISLAAAIDIVCRIDTREEAHAQDHEQAH